MLQNALLGVFLRPIVGQFHRYVAANFEIACVPVLDSAFRDSILKAAAVFRRRSFQCLQNFQGRYQTLLIEVRQRFFSGQSTIEQSRRG